MAVKMKLVKGPTLQWIIVLVLMTLAGLGYPPDFCEAIKCYSCRGDKCAGVEIDCSKNFTACSVVQGSKLADKSCSDGYLQLGKQKFDCIQKIVGGSGSCINGDGADMDIALCKCGIYRPDLPICTKTKAAGRRRRETEGSNLWTDISGRDGGGPEPNVGPIKACSCNTDLCNTDELFANLGSGGTNEKGGKGNGAGLGALAGRNMETISGLMVTLSLLATKGLLY